MYNLKVNWTYDIADPFQVLPLDGGRNFLERKDAEIIEQMFSSKVNKTVGTVTGHKVI